MTPESFFKRVQRWVWASAPWVAAAAILAGGVAMRMAALPASALVEYDTWGWLKPALEWAGGGGFRENAEREWLYAAFLAGCFRLFGSVDSVVWVQMAAGLAAGGLLFAAWLAWSRLLPARVVTRAAALCGGLFVLAAYVGNPNLIAFEMALRPESLLVSTGLMAIFCGTLYSIERWKNGATWRSVAFGLPIPVLAGMIATFKPSWALALPVIGLPVVAGVLGRVGSFPRRVIPLAGGCLLAVVLVVLPDKLLFQKSSEPRLVLPMTLLTIHADAVVSAMHKRLAAGGYPAGEREIIASALPVLEADLAAARANPYNYRRLGFDPDYIMYRAGIFPFLINRYGYTRAQLAAFCHAGYRDAWRYEPGMMLGKAATQLGFLAFPDGRTYSKKRVDLQALTRHTLDVAPKSLDESFGGPVRAMWAAYRERSEAAAARQREIRPWKALDKFLRERMPPAVAMGALVFLVAVLSWVLPLLRPLRGAGLLAIFYAAVPLGNAFTVAFVHALDNDRYRMTYGPFVVLAITAAAVLAVAAVELALRAVIGRIPNRPRGLEK